VNDEEMSYKDSLDFVLQLPDEIFSPIIDAIQFNDFGDNYYEIGTQNDDLSSSIKGLKRRYNDYFAYLDAKALYDEYMDSLIEKYGSKSIVKSTAKAGMLPEYLPPKPKLKNSKRNRAMQKAGIVSRRDDSMYCMDGIVAAAEEDMPVNEEKMEEISPDSSVDKATLRNHEKAEESINRRMRRNGLYRSSYGENCGTDFIIEYLNQASKGFYDTLGKHHENSLCDIMKENEIKKYMPSELYEDEFEAPKTEFKDGRLVNTKDLEQIKLLEELYEAGFNFIGGNAKGINKQAVKIARKEVGYGAQNMSKKELKKWKKRHKNERKMLEKREQADNILSEALLNNKFDFYDKDRGSGNFRLKDLYRDND
jgi:hypothetical protein